MEKNKKFSVFVFLASFCYDPMHVCSEISWMSEKKDRITSWDWIGRKLEGFREIGDLRVFSFC